MRELKYPESLELSKRVKDAIVTMRAKKHDAVTLNVIEALRGVNIVFNAIIHRRYPIEKGDTVT